MTESSGRYQAFDLATGKARDVFPETTEKILAFDFSADQKRIVYVTKKPDSANRLLVVANRQFQNKRVLKTIPPGKMSPTSDDAFPRFLPSWSPDGTMIAYHPDRGETELWVMASDGAWETKVHTGSLTVVTFDATPPKWSPDSTKLGMVLVGQGRGEIGLLESFLPEDRIAAN